MWLPTFILLTLAISTFGQRMMYGDGKFQGDEAYSCVYTKADIVFIIDGSRSIYVQEFDEQIEFLKSFVNHFTIGDDNVRFGAVTFGNKIIRDNTFKLNEYTRKDQLKNRISKINYRPLDGSSTQTHLAIKYARENLFNNILRPSKKIAIVITDGKSTVPKKTKEQAIKMREEGIVTLAVGVGQNVSKEELRIITGREDYVFMVDKYSLLKSIEDTLSKKACQTTDEACKGAVDINFVFDTSMMGSKDISYVTSFIMKSITSENFAEERLRFGTIVGKCQSMKSFSLDTYYTRSDVEEHFDKFHQTSFASLVGETLRVAFTPEHGGRKGARRVAVIFLKGKLSEPEKVVRNAKALPENGIEVFVVKMDDMNSDEILTDITEERNILDATSEKRTTELSNEFVDRLCRM